MLFSGRESSSDMSDPALSTIAAFSKALQDISPEWTKKQRASRGLLVADPLEELVPVKLLKEGLGQFLDRTTPGRSPFILFMDRAGGRAGLRATLELLPFLGTKRPGLTLIFVQFILHSAGNVRYRSELSIGN